MIFCGSALQYCQKSSSDLRLQAKQLVDSASRPGAFQRVLSLQFDAFWQNHSRKVIAAGAVLLLYVLWYAMILQQVVDSPCQSFYL